MATQPQRIRAKHAHKVPSKSVKGLAHTVELEPDHCTCQAFYYKRDCSHIKHVRRLAWFAELEGVTVAQIEANLQAAKLRGGCGEVHCYWCAVNHKLGCARTSDASTRELVNVIHGYQINAA